MLADEPMWEPGDLTHVPLELLCSVWAISRLKWESFWCHTPLITIFQS